MAKNTTTIWAIQTTYDERGGRKIKNYYATRELAVQDAGKYHDWMNPWPIEPDDEHIIPIEVITEL